MAGKDARHFRVDVFLLSFLNFLFLYLDRGCNLLTLLIGVTSLLYKYFVANHSVPFQVTPSGKIYHLISFNSEATSGIFYMLLPAPSGRDIAPQKRTRGSATTPTGRFYTLLPATWSSNHTGTPTGRFHTGTFSYIVGET